MKQEYDPDHPATWPEQEKEFSQRVWLALIDGDLGPLVEYLRSSLPMDRELREVLARHIEGRDTLHKIWTKKSGAPSWGKASRSGPWSVRREVARDQERLAIFEIVGALTASDAGAEARDPIQKEPAVAYVAELFGLGRSTVYSLIAQHEAILDARIDGLSFWAGGRISKQPRE